MKSKFAIKIFIHSLVILFALLSTFCSGRKYEITDYFIDTSDYGKIVFMFVETSSKNEKYLQFAAETIFSTHPDLEEKDSMLVVLIVHFFSRESAEEPPNEVIAKLRADYPHAKDLEARLDYIPDGFVYTAFSREVPGLDVPQDSLFQLPIFVPKLGIKARDVLKKTKKKQQQPLISTDTAGAPIKLDTLLR